VVAVGGGYTTPGQTDLHIIRNRNSRFLFNILDTGGDGICCNTGTLGSFKIFVDSVLQADKGKFGTSDTVLFGEEVCNDVTFKPTNVLTASPTNNPTIVPTGQPSNKPTSLPTNTLTVQPTGLPTASADVEIKIEIRFDLYPEDISWELYNSCNGGNEKIGEDGNYGDLEKGKTVQVYNKTIHDGTFKFVIFDKYGDGLCCTREDGGYTIFYGLKEFPRSFSDPNDEETLMFGFANKCASVEIKIDIKFDDYPVDTSWDLYNTCNGGNEKVGQGGNYGDSYAGKSVTVYGQSVHDGTFKFVIFDKYGDGLCCTQGDGGYTIFYGLKEFPSSFLGPNEEETLMFGFANKCAPASPPNTPTHQPTGPTKLPTLLPTSLPTALTNVEIKIDIKFDDYPVDISWDIYNTCNGDSEKIGQGGNYGDFDTGKSVTVYRESVHEGIFKFVIFDSHGDGLCCTQGDGNYIISYGDTKLFSTFKDPTFNETRHFGEANKCALSQINKASYDSSLGVPKCGTVDKSCTTVGTGPTGELKGELLIAKDLWGEANGSNTLDTCSDGNSGEYKLAESVESITVEAVGGGVLRAGGTARVVARIYTYGNGETNRVDFYSSTTPGPNPNWKPITINVKPENDGLTEGGGYVEVEVKSGEFPLSDVELQAVRVSIRWTPETLESTACPTSAGDDSGKFSDVDDLAFVVDTTSLGGTMSFALSQPSPVVLPELLEELQMNCADVLESDRCEAAIDCEWRSDSILGSFMSLGMSSCHLLQ